MNYPRRGKCIILNHEDFSVPYEYKKRVGTNVDCQSLEQTFSNLGFDLEIHKDLNYDEIMALLKKVWCVLTSSIKHCLLIIIYLNVSVFGIG